MDVAFLIKEYFKGVEGNISIDVFDARTLNSVYTNVLKVLTSHFEINTSVLQSLSYCFYEILDNDIIPGDIVDNRSDVESEFNEPFLQTDELDSLW